MPVFQKLKAQSFQLTAYGFLEFNIQVKTYTSTGWQTC